MDRDPAAIHTNGLGTRLEHVIADHATLSAFPKPGVAGRLARAVDTGTIYRDNASAWQVWVSSGGASLPITVNDGTTTYAIELGGSNDLHVLAFNNATPSRQAEIFVAVDPTGVIQGAINASTVSKAAGISVQVNGAVTQVAIVGLPTSDPGVSGALWNSTGTVKISP